MKDGFVKTAAITPSVRVADVKFNVREMARLVKEYAAKGCKLIVFPELAVTGYTAADLFTQDTLICAAEEGLLSLAEATANCDCATVVGVPLVISGKLYNCAAVLKSGGILGVAPKTEIPNYGEFYEARHFVSARDLDTDETELGGVGVPVGTDLVFVCEKMPQFAFGVEICEDMRVPGSPAESLRRRRDDRMQSFRQQRADRKGGIPQAARQGGERQKSVRIYICGRGDGREYHGRGICGHDMIAEDSTVLAESEPFGNGAAIAEIDVFMLDRERRRQSTFHACDNARKIYFDCKTEETQLTRNVSPTPFVPADKEGRDKRCKLIFDIQAGGLAKRIIHTGTKKAVVGLSGGLDSALALAVTVKAVRMAGLSPSDVLAVTMPCFGTTSRTRNNAELLAKGLGTDFREVPIGEAVKVHLRDIGHPIDVTDVAYENAQARERTQVLMDIANMCGGLVVGTGDLSEAALGWSTYNGDHMSMYCVNTSVPKTLVRYLVAYYADTCGSEDAAKALRDILDTPISPELIPAENGRIVQKTEEIVGSYDLNDFFLYYTVRRGFRPRKVLRLAKIAFGGVYGDKELRSGLEKFYRRFFAQQFKRSCTPDGPKVGSVALSPRGDWRMPSDACPDAWLDDLK